MIRKILRPTLTPFRPHADLVLDAAASMGFEGDGILFALNSYENRVYQLAGRTSTGSQILPPGALERCADQRRACFCHRACRRRFARGRAGRGRGRYAAALSRIRFAAFPWQRGRARSWMRRIRVRFSAGASRASTRSVLGGHLCTARASRSSVWAGRHPRTCSQANCFLRLSRTATRTYGAASRAC